MNRVGKLSMEELRKLVFPYKGVPDDRILLGPAIGGDAAVVDVDGSYLILKGDPITGAVANIGREALHIASNDIAVLGGTPRWYIPIIILPTSSSERDVKRIMMQINEVACDLGISVVGGHTEFSSSVSRPVVCGFLIGFVEEDRLIQIKNAKPGDKLILTKGAAVEATSIIAADLSERVKLRFGADFLRRCKAFDRMISVVEEAAEAIKAGGVTAMHDPTEGGISTALHEMAEASDNGFLVYEERIFVAEETRKLCSYFKIDPFSSISSGSLLIAVRPRAALSVLESLRKTGIRAEIIGEVKPKELGRKIMLKDGRVEDFLLPETDELWLLFKRLENAEGKEEH